MILPSETVRPRIVIAEPDDFSPTALGLLRQRAEVTLRRYAPGQLGEALENYDVVWIRLGHTVDEATVAKSSRCRILASPVTGTDHIDLNACARAGIRVVSLQGESTFLRKVRGTAELTVGLAIALLRRIVPAAGHVMDGGWDRDQFRGRELYGGTAGIVGVGRLGSIVSGYLTAMGMSVIGHDPASRRLPHIEYVDTLGELFARSDLITLHARYDHSTHHLIDSEVLACLRPSSILVNTARGGLIDNAALLDALQTGRLAGAALDVVEGEPQVGIDHALVRYATTHSNLLIVPHIGGNTEESFEKTEQFLAERVLEALDEQASSRSGQ